MPHGNPDVGFSNAMPHGETSLVVGSGWNSPLAYICLLKGDNSVKILQSRINGGSVARRLITRGSTSCTFFSVALPRVCLFPSINFHEILFRCLK